MADLDLSGWQPAWAPGGEQLPAQAARLKSLIGRRICGAWIVWNVVLDEWLADLPVVLEFDGGAQLEVCWQKFDDLSVTWNTIDLSVTPRAWVSWPLEWRSGAHQALRQIAGQQVVRVEATEVLFTAGQASTWLTGGIWLQTSSGGLHIFDGLDENGLSSEPPGRSSHERRGPIVAAP